MGDRAHPGRQGELRNWKSGKKNFSRTPLLNREFSSGSRLDPDLIQRLLFLLRLCLPFRRSVKRTDVIEIMCPSASTGCAYRSAAPFMASALRTLPLTVTKPQERMKIMCGASKNLSPEDTKTTKKLNNKAATGEKVERAVPSALRWAPSHRLRDKPIHLHPVGVIRRADTNLPTKNLPESSRQQQAGLGGAGRSRTLWRRRRTHRLRRIVGGLL